MAAQWDGVITDGDMAIVAANYVWTDHGEEWTIELLQSTLQQHAEFLRKRGYPDEAIEHHVGEKAYDWVFTDVYNQEDIPMTAFANGLAKGFDVSPGGTHVASDARVESHPSRLD